MKIMRIGGACLGGYAVLYWLKYQTRSVRRQAKHLN